MLRTKAFDICLPRELDTCPLVLVNDCLAAALEMFRNI
jgi:hypothetical protein